MALSSCLFECRVLHRRLTPKPYQFVHRLMMWYLDLDELPALQRTLRLLSVERRNVFSFRDRDYCPTGTSGNLKARVLAYLAERNVILPLDARIRLLTLPPGDGLHLQPDLRVLLLHIVGEPICALAEVGNTYRESKLFLLPPATLRTDRRRFQLRVPKNYYVSPFSSLELNFDFDLQLPGNSVQLQIDD